MPKALHSTQMEDYEEHLAEPEPRWDDNDSLMRKAAVQRG